MKSQIKNQDEFSRILILDVKVSENDFLLFTLYNTTKESEQLDTLSNLCNLLNDITILHCKNIILRGDFNIVFNLTFEGHGGNPNMKNKSVVKFMYIKETLGLCDISRVRNPNKKHTFRQQYVTGYIQRRQDYSLVSSALEESIYKMDILTTLSTDHSSVFPLSRNIEISRGKGLWKFNNCLCHKLNFVTELKNNLKVICNRI